MVDAFFTHYTSRTQALRDIRSLLHWPTRLELVSPDLSAAENIKISMASKWCFSELIAFFIEETPWERRGLVAAFALCSHLSPAGRTDKGSFISYVLPFLDHSAYTFCSSKHVSERKFFRTSAATILDYLCQIWAENLFETPELHLISFYAAQALALLETSLQLDTAAYIDLWYMEDGV